MSPSIEQYVRKVLKTRDLSSTGTVTTEDIDPNLLSSTRPFLNPERLARPKKRRASPDDVEAIEVNGTLFVIDGHHKAKKAIRAGGEVKCRILHTTNHLLETKLERARHGSVSDLEVKNKID